MFDELIRRDLEPPTDVYLKATTKGAPYRFHCIYCTKPVATIENQIVRIIDRPNALTFAIAVGNSCKRCKKMYRFILV